MNFRLFLFSILVFIISCSDDTSDVVSDCFNITCPDGQICQEGNCIDTMDVDTMNEVYRCDYEINQEICQRGLSGGRWIPFRFWYNHTIGTIGYYTAKDAQSLRRSTYLEFIDDEKYDFRYREGNYFISEDCSKIVFEGISGSNQLEEFEILDLDNVRMVLYNQNLCSDTCVFIKSTYAESVQESFCNFWSQCKTFQNQCDDFGLCKCDFGWHGYGCDSRYFESPVDDEITYLSDSIIIFARNSDKLFYDSNFNLIGKQTVSNPRFYHDGAVVVTKNDSFHIYRSGSLEIKPFTQGQLSIREYFSLEDGRLIIINNSTRVWEDDKLCMLNSNYDVIWSLDIPHLFSTWQILANDEMIVLQAGGLFKVLDLSGQVISEFDAPSEMIVSRIFIRSFRTSCYVLKNSTIIGYTFNGDKMKIIEIDQGGRIVRSKEHFVDYYPEDFLSAVQIDDGDKILFYGWMVSNFNGVGFSSQIALLEFDKDLNFNGSHYFDNKHYSSQIALHSKVEVIDGDYCFLASVGGKKLLYKIEISDFYPKLPVCFF